MDRRRRRVISRRHRPVCRAPRTLSAHCRIPKAASVETVAVAPWSWRERGRMGAAGP